MLRPDPTCLYKNKRMGENTVGKNICQDLRRIISKNWTGSKNWTHKLRLTWNSLCCSKETPVQKYTVIAIYCQEIIFHIWVWTSSFWFQSYFGRPFHGVSCTPLNYGEGLMLFKEGVLSLWGDCSTWRGLMIRSYQRGRSFTNFIFQ